MLRGCTGGGGVKRLYWGGGVKRLYWGGVKGLNWGGGGLEAVLGGVKRLYWGGGFRGCTGGGGYYWGGLKGCTGGGVLRGCTEGEGEGCYWGRKGGSLEWCSR